MGSNFEAKMQKQKTVYKSRNIFFDVETVYVV